MGGPSYHHVEKAHATLISNHGRNTSSIHVRKACPTITSIIMVGHTIYHSRKGPTLTYTSMIRHTINHLGKGPTLTYTGMIGHTIYHPDKGPTLTSNHGRNQFYCHVIRALQLHLTMGGTNPTSMLEGLCTYI